MSKVFEREGSPYWYVRLSDPRAPRGIVIVSTKEKAKTRAQAKVPSMQAAIDQQVAAAELQAENACGMTWLDALNIFLRQGDLKPSTITSYWHGSKAVVGILGNFDLGQLTHEQIRDFCQQRRQMSVRPPGAADTGRTVSDQTIRNNLSMMSSLYKFVIDMDLPNRPKSNPFKTFERDFLRTSKKVDHHLRPMQFDEAMAACKIPLHRAMLMVLVGTGMRSSEVRNLHWPEVDFKNGVIEFGNSDPTRSKTDRARRIPLLPRVSEELLTHFNAQKRTPNFEPRGLVFPGWRKDPNGKKVQVVRYDLKYLIKMIRDRTSVKGYRNHGLRHTFASWGRQQGLDADAIRRAMGHTTTSTTDRYAHHIDDSMMEQFRKMVLPVCTQNDTQSN